MTVYFCSAGLSVFSPELRLFEFQPCRPFQVRVPDRRLQLMFAKQTQFFGGLKGRFLMTAHAPERPPVANRAARFVELGIRPRV